MQKATSCTMLSAPTPPAPPRQGCVGAGVGARLGEGRFGRHRAPRRGTCHTECSLGTPSLPSDRAGSPPGQGHAAPQSRCPRPPTLWAQAGTDRFLACLVFLLY